MYDMVNFLFAKASCCSLEHRENHFFFFGGESQISDFPSTQLLGGWQLAGLVSVVAPNSCSLYLCFHQTPSNRPPLGVTGSSIPPSRARVPTKTSPPCGLAGFKKGFAGVAGVGSNRW